MSSPDKKLELYGFQQESVNRLYNIRNVLIGDDMGIGKTAQAIALDLKRRKIKDEWKHGKTLVVAPLGVVKNWAREIRAWSDLSVTTIDRKNRNPFLADVWRGKHDVYVMHWPGLRLMPELAKFKWFHVIGDECHFLQNRKSKQSIALKRIQATFKTGLSGTPAFDKPDDLWSVLNWLYPSFWNSYWNYFDRYVQWINCNGYKTITGVANEFELQMQMRGFYIRRLKQEVIKDLPDIIGPTRHIVDLTPKQRKAYNSMRDNMIAWIGQNEDQEIDVSVIIAKLTRLQQFACAYGEIVTDLKPKRIQSEDAHRVWKAREEGRIDDNGYFIDEHGKRTLFPHEKMVLTDPSSKIDAVMDIIQATNKQIVVFSQFSQVIDLLVERLKNNKITFGKYIGSTSTEDRNNIVEDFKTRKIQIFAGTLGAGGTGLDGLQVSDTVIFIDRSWSASVNNQAIARLHRIGQKNAVHVIDIIAGNTIDSKRIEQINMQWSWIKTLLGENDD